MSDRQVEPAKVHRKQFIIGPEPVRIDDDWLAQPLSAGVHLSSCPELRQVVVADADGRLWALLGLVTQSVADRPDPADDIAATHTNDVANRSHTWAGRWVLIGDDRVYPDASAMLGVFHGRDAQGRVWASSSPALLARCLGISLPRQDASLTYEKGITWHLLPGSAIDGVFHLLPSAVLNLQSGEIEHRPLLPALPVETDGDAALASFEQAMVESCRRLSQFGLPIEVSLSGGGDSRLVFSAAKAAGLELNVFTRVSTRMSVADYLLPPMFAKRLGCPHRYITPKGHDPQRIDMVWAHTAGHVPIGEAQPFIERHRDSIRGITLGGQCIGAGKVVFRRGTQPRYDSRDDLIAAIVRVHGATPTDSLVRGLRDWAQWMDDHPVENLDWRDRFFLEQRMAGWQSAKEQLYDMQPHERFIPINCARTYALVLSIPQERRVTFGHHAEVIRRLTPQIGDDPFNPPDSYFGLGRAWRLRLLTLQSWREPAFMLRLIARNYRKKRAARRS